MDNAKKAEASITVFGATGKAGRELLQILSNDGLSVQAVTRDLKNAVSMKGVEWVQADLNDVRSVEEILKTTRSVFLSTGFTPQMSQMQGNIIHAAAKAGVNHVVKLSYGLMSAQLMKRIHSETHKQHQEIEAALMSSGPNWTILRASGFMQNWLTGFPPTVKSEHKIYESAGAGKMAYIDARDIAAVAAEVMAEPQNHYGKIYELTGGEAISFYQVADAISRTIGKTITYVPETPSMTIQRLTQKGYPLWAVDMLLTIAQSQRDGNEAETTQTVEDVLKRTPLTVYQFAEAYKEFFE
jgi:uncharacterized protein YbjT (DUF2867 family)